MRVLLRAALLVAGVFVMLAAAGCGSTGRDAAVATVNGAEISHGAAIDRVERTVTLENALAQSQFDAIPVDPANPDAAASGPELRTLGGVAPKSDYRSAVDELIDESLVSAEVEARKLTVAEVDASSPEQVQITEAVGADLAAELGAENARRTALEADLNGVTLDAWLVEARSTATVSVDEEVGFWSASRGIGAVEVPTFEPVEPNADCFELADTPNEFALAGEGPAGTVSSEVAVDPALPAPALPAYYGIGDDDSPAATVDGFDITNAAVLQDVEAEVRFQEISGTTSPSRGPGLGTYTTAEVARAARNLIIDAAVVAELDERGLEVSAADCETALASLGEVPAEFDRGYINRVVARQASIQTLLAALVAEGEPTIDPCVRHILVDTAEEADAVFARLDDGEDFAALAIELSTDTGSGAQGGALGCQPLSQWVPEFAAALGELEIGGRSEAVQSQFGFHIIERTEPTAADIAAAEANLSNTALQTWATEDLGVLDISVDERIGTWVPQTIDVVAAQG